MKSLDFIFIALIIFIEYRLNMAGSKTLLDIEVNLKTMLKLYSEREQVAQSHVIQKLLYEFFKNLPHLEKNIAHQNALNAYEAHMKNILSAKMSGSVFRGKKTFNPFEVI